MVQKVALRGEGRHTLVLEYLAQTVWTNSDEGPEVAYPDTVVGTDSHTTMINGLAVLGWGVGGIEAEAAMLGQPISMLIPEIVGFKLTGKLREGVTATDLVLTVTQMLRKKGVVGKFVEYYGPGLDELTLEDRATLANMAPEYGATCGFFPIDAETVRFLKNTARKPARVALVEKYAKAQGLTIVSKDSDFQERSMLWGSPPKVIWLRIPNCNSSEIAEVLRNSLGDIQRFVSQDNTTCLELGK